MPIDSDFCLKDAENCDIIIFAAVMRHSETNGRTNHNKKVKTMLEHIKEKELWQVLKEEKLPILLYGMGNGADMIIEELEKIGVSFSDTFASDGFVRGQLFHGKTVLTLSRAEEKYGEFVILMTFAVHDEKTLSFVKELSKKHRLYSPTVPIAGKGLFNLQYIIENEKRFDKAFEILADEKSKRTFLDVLNFKISGKPEYLFDCESDKSEVYEKILKLSKNETIADLGAYDGDTIREFLSFTENRYGHIFAFEPDEKNFRKLTAKTEGFKNLSLFNLGAWDKKEALLFEKKAGRNSHKSVTGVPVNFDSVDNVVNLPLSFIKMDIEGAELKALDGAKDSIKKFKPKLYVCAYHRNEDFFILPEKILSIRPDYKIYLRHHPYVPAWETNFYCI